MDVESEPGRGSPRLGGEVSLESDGFEFESLEERRDGVRAALAARGLVGGSSNGLGVGDRGPEVTDAPHDRASLDGRREERHP